MRILKYKVFFYTSKLRAQFTLLNYARIAGIIFTENYVKKILFTPQNYAVEFCNVIYEQTNVEVFSDVCIEGGQ
jgi:hypothetical protein